MTIALLLIGCGNVGRRFVALLEESRPALEALDVQPRIVGVVTRRGGALLDSAGLDANRIARGVAEGGAVGPASVPSTLEWFARVRSQDVEARVVIETTTLDIRSGEPAVSHVRGALSAGAHVITANKGPAAFAFHDLDAAARAAGLSFLFEGAVMDGIPVLSLVRECLPACQVRGFRGVVNSTTNYMLTSMESGLPFDVALKTMQDAGIAEADPSLDVDGWDAAAKTAVLANVWLDARTTPPAVEREGLTPDAAERAIAARRDGRALKLVASSARDDDGRVRARVALEVLEPDDPLATLDGQANAIEIDTWPAGRIVITQRDGGLEKTAYALLSDLITVARRVRAGATGGRR